MALLYLYIYIGYDAVRYVAVRRAILRRVRRNVLQYTAMYRNMPHAT